MAKAGAVKTTTGKEKSFSGSGVEGQKGAGEETPPENHNIFGITTKALLRDVILSLSPEFRAEARQILNELDGTLMEAPASVQETAAAPPEKAEPFDKTGAEYNVQMRHGKPHRVWFRDGKEIGVENAG